MRLLRILSLLFGAGAASVVRAGGFGTPEDAVRGLEQAYFQKNVDAAVAAKDFDEEARLMLQKMDPKLAGDPAILKQTAEVLELGFREELRTKGFPDFGKLKCSFVGKAQISAGLVKLTEQCVFQDGGKSVQDLFAAKSALGWRVVITPPSDVPGDAKAALLTVRVAADGICYFLDTSTPCDQLGNYLAPMNPTHPVAVQLQIDPGAKHELVNATRDSLNRAGVKTVQKQGYVTNEVF